MKVALTIAGLDPSGGAGITADIKTFTAFDCFATSALSSVTFQNTQGVFGSIPQTADSIRRQILPIIDDFEVSAVKTGMLPTTEIIEEVAKIIVEFGLKNIVVDPVVRSTSGFDLIDDTALKSLVNKLLPLSNLVTPNLPEAERISGMKINNEDDVKKAARIIQGFGAKNVLIKGGHIWKVESEQLKVKSENRKATDYLFAGNNLHIFESEFIETTSTHGTGCTLAAAIAANLANGKTIIEAVEISKRFVNLAIRLSPNLGKGNSSVNHNVRL
jgi:hydroxymethylpyrimidine kinase/phosphomethylpyrimidine kinase